ncbi:Pre-toxin TG [Clostridium uliginosum]|uniref:Pre-toxin TG n=1 Tax=Clostridium uliginosum TaxID=119641 RepID=A0A1I1R0T7_9CLOT|nr:Pre-toxin TG [Clostridium uliginosum]
MHKEYEDMKVEIDVYNASLSEQSAENTSNFMSKLIFDAEINKKKIDSYDKYINEMITSSDFDYETNDERTISMGAYFIPVLGEYKMLAEIVDGKDLVSGRRYSVGEQLFAIGAVGAGSLIGKVYKGVKAGLASGVEETSGKIAEGTVFAMNGVRDSSGIEKLAKSITEKVVGKGERIKGATDPKKIKDTLNGGLDVHESMGGHLLEKHVGKTEQELLDRLKNQPKISGSSSFSDKNIAEDVCYKILSNKNNKIKINE